MKQLVDAYLAGSCPCMVMMLHSASFVPGLSPYVPDESRLEEFYRDMCETFEYCLQQCGMVGDTLSGFADSLRERLAPQESPIA